MVIEVITASSFYLRLVSPRCFIPWVEANGRKTSSNHLKTSYSSPFYSTFPVLPTCLLVFIQCSLTERSLFQQHPASDVVVNNSFSVVQLLCCLLVTEPSSWNICDEVLFLKATLFILQVILPSQASISRLN